MTPLVPAQVQELIQDKGTIADGLMQMQDRYLFDFELCHFKKGWAQIDTDQDASYYGNWANPLTRQTVSYIEGDVRITRHDTDEAYAKHLRDWAAWSKEAGHTFKIDGMCNREIIGAFNALDLSDLLH